MKFRYKKMKILLLTALFVAALLSIHLVTDKLGTIDLNVLWLFLFAIIIVLLVYHGDEKLNKLQIDKDGLSVKRVFRPNLRINFSDIKTLRLIKDESAVADKNRELEIRIKPQGVFTVTLKHLQLNKEFVRMMYEGFQTNQREL